MVDFGISFHLCKEKLGLNHEKKSSWKKKTAAGVED